MSPQNQPQIQIEGIFAIFAELQKSIKQFRGDKTIKQLAEEMEAWVNLAKRLHREVEIDQDRLAANLKAEAARMNRQLADAELLMTLDCQAMFVALAVAYDVYKHSIAAANARQAKAMAEISHLQSEAMTKRRKAMAAADEEMAKAAHWGEVAKELQIEVAELKRELLALQAELNFENKPTQVRRKKARGGRGEYEE